MVYSLLYIFSYCNIDKILNKIFFNNYKDILANELIQTNNNFYYTISNLNLFVLFIYSFYIIKNLYYYKPVNNIINILGFIYIKYIFSFFLNNNITIYEYETSRNIMWLFTTPLMLKLYCNVNNIKLIDINAHYHIIPVTINIFIYPFKNTLIYYFFICVSWMFLLYFIKTLIEKKSLRFTNIYIFIWFIFMFLNIIELAKITNIYNINLYYSFADTISKMMTCIMMNDYYEEDLRQLNNVDLQSIQFMSIIVKTIDKYKKENLILTNQCKKLIDSSAYYFLSKIPTNQTIIEQELLRKILPFNFDKDYITNINMGAKQFDMICILFADIINYTELAQKYDDKIIFSLLNSVYTTFDNIIKKYKYLQKIETIGDAYMIVGDIFRDKYNHVDVIKEIILFAIDILNEIKNIKTPDNIPLCLRIGINMGPVSIGILGNEIPRLCIVGHAVNMASRLQSTAEKDTIQFSKHIYDQIKNIKFDIPIDILIKENIFLKNIGFITTYNITLQTRHS